MSYSSFTACPLLQLRNLPQRLLVNLLDPQMFLQPAVAVETGGGVERVRSVVELHLFVFGAEAVQIFLGRLLGDGIAGGKLQKDAFTVGVAEKINRIVPGIFAKIV